MLIAAVIMLGLVVGSFLNVVIHRVPVMLNQDSGAGVLTLAWPRSHCPHCKHTLRWYELIPLLSFCLQSGRCRHCAATIAWRYPAVEAIYAVLALVCYLQFGLSVDGGFYCLFFAITLSLWVIDYRHQLLPDCLTLSGLWLGLLYSTVGDHIAPSESILAAASAYVLLRVVGDLYALLRRQTGMGGGDMKLLAMLGAWFGSHVLFILMAGVSLALVVSLGRFFSRQLKWQQAVAFGPFLIVVSWLWVWFAAALPDWL